MITVRKILQVYDNIEEHLPQEILNLQCGTELYNKKHLIIKEFFKNYIQNR